MKMLLSLILTAATVCAGEYKYNSGSYGNASSKAEAMAAAISRLPYGAEIKKIEFNGWNIKNYATGRDVGTYNCKVTYGK
jgi:hypothetical protein